MNERKILKSEERKKKYYDAFYASFHGFDKLEKEFRADGYYRGKASDFVKHKEELIRLRPLLPLNNPSGDCFVVGPYRALGMLKDVVVILHGPIGCAHYLYMSGAWFEMARVVCTQTDENDILGGYEEKLIKTVEDTIDRFHPGMIAVISACSTSIIEADIFGICDAMERKTGIPIIAFPAAGFRHKSWNLAAEEALNRVIDRMQRTDKKNKGSVNLINLPLLVVNWLEVFQLIPYFEELGIKLNMTVPFYVTFSEFLERYPQAELNVMRCPGVGYQSSEYAEKMLGIPYLQLPKPLTLEYTKQFLRGLGDFFGCQRKVEALIDREENRIKDRWEGVKSRLKGKRIAISTCSGRNVAVAQLATELGMEVVFLNSFKTDPRYHDFLEDWIKSSGQDPPIGADLSLYEEEAVFNELRPDFILSALEGIWFADCLGIPSLSQAINPNPALIGFEGAVQYAELIARSLESEFYKNWSVELWGKSLPYACERYRNTPSCKKYMDNPTL